MCALPDAARRSASPIKKGRIANQGPPRHLLAQSRGFQRCGPQHCGLGPRGNRQMQGQARRATVTALGQEILGTAGQCAWIQWRAGVGQRIVMQCTGDQVPQLIQIGRASCRERVWQYVSISVVAVSLKKTKKNNYYIRIISRTTSY